MPVPIIYRKSQEGAIVTYDYVDLAEGTGIIAINAAQVNISGSSLFILNRNALYSAAIEMLVDGSAGGGASVTNNFNLSSFNLPRTAQGTALINFSAINLGSTLDIKFTLQRVRGSVVTDLGFEWMQRMTGAVALTHLIPITIPKTIFKKGDILRLAVYMFATGGISYVGIDPQNRNGTHFTAATNPTKMTIYMPWRIDQ